MKCFIALLLVSCNLISFGQETYPYNGVANKNPGHYALTNARIVVAPGEIIQKGTLEIKDGTIIQVQTGSKHAKEAVVIDMDGYTIYPGFIDLWSNYGMSGSKLKGDENDWDEDGSPQTERKSSGNRHWNESIHPETQASEILRHQPEKAEQLMQMGFTTVNAHLFDGIARGTSVTTTLRTDNQNISVLKTKASSCYSIDAKGSSQQSYPSSLMGMIALLRQTFYDAEWYGEANAKKEQNLSLEALNAQKNLPTIFEAKGHQQILRAIAISTEFDLNALILGKGDEYLVADRIKEYKSRLIVPMAFPKPIDIQDPYDGMLVPLSILKEWEMAPYNAYLLYKSGVPFAITATLNKQPKEFLSNLRKAVANGFPEQEALKALTSYPAEILGINDITGSLHSGKLANFIIVKGNIFTDNVQIHETWVQGKRSVFNPLKELNIKGTYTLNVGGRIRTLHIENDQEYVVLRDKDTTEAIVLRDERKITVAYHETDSLTAGTVRLSGMIHLDGAAWDGQGQWTDGTWVNWNAIKKAPKNATQAPKSTEKSVNSTKPKLLSNGKKNEMQDTIPVPAYTYPLGAYGLDSIPADFPILIKNVTIWTSESIGIMQGSVLIRNGKIHKIGDILDAADTKTIIIDGTGKHLTSGIIDEHSHIAADGSVNEGGQNNSAEVRLGDVIDATDINIYRQLAGGVTCAQILHGSANPIGGQSAVIKLKWGHTAEDMLLNPQPKYIKFALGENVKQSNWGDNQTVRFPQSRMGVEQVYYDAFIRAREYDEAWKRYNDAPGGKKKKTEVEKPRRDLELETLAEILRGERFITCHSYVQSEIVMLMRVADSMKFTLNTFTHILEGYKVADKMKKHGAGASTFSDWWAYKYEVKDAIPYNAAMLNKMGIVTAINSDDAEMGRRLNQEAAKAVKYGGVSEEDALKMVTLNPAKLLKIDHRTGSIKEGKDADLVLWSGHPLSIYSQAEKTIIDGRIYFDRSIDITKMARDAKEKAHLLGKMIEAKQKGAEMRPLFPDDKHYFKCSDN